MWPKLKCWLLGHHWKQFGISETKHVKLKDNTNIVLEDRVKSHLIFYCKCCCKIWEYECYTRYQFSETDDEAVTSSSEPTPKD